MRRFSAYYFTHQSSPFQRFLTSENAPSLLKCSGKKSMAKIRGKRDLFSATLGKTSPQKGKAFRKVQHGLIYPTALLPMLLESLLTATHK